jgi:hypothetical protein
MSHRQLAEAARDWIHIPYYRVGMVEVGLPNGTRIDALSWELKNNTFRLIECKANLRDLKSAPKQLSYYRRYADLLYLCVPEELEKEARELLPPKVGLLVVGYGDYNRTYLSTSCVRNPRRVPIDSRSRGPMVARATTWLLTHYENSKVCRGCGYKMIHGPA